MSRLCIGIIVNSILKQQYVGDLVVRAGHEIVYTGTVLDDSVFPDISAADVWVVDLCDESTDEPAYTNRPSTQFLQRLLEQTDVPVVVNEDPVYGLGTVEHNSWVRRMLGRLERLSGDVNLQQSTKASEVWILAASTGGPAAVKTFLNHLPALDMAFLYVQHIDSNHAEPLVKMMSDAGCYSVRLATQGVVLTKNTVTLITAGRSIDIHANGTLVINKDVWSGCYAPSIDRVAANVARIYGQHCGIIIFTGMGDDGAASCRLIKQQGGKVWAQTPASCVVASMPDTAIRTGTVELMGTPAELAIALAHLNHHL